MRSNKRIFERAAAVIVLALPAFSLWYRGGDPLTRAEREYYSQSLQELASELSADLARFIDAQANRKFMASDDGRPFLFGYAMAGIRSS